MLLKNWQNNFLQVIKNFSDITFSTSFSIEDQLITDFIVQEKLPIEIFTIDTGRLPRETYDVWQNTLDRYQVKIAAFYPEEKSLQEFIGNNGINPFYISKELRLNCCAIRKVEPLQRALRGKKLWISGLRKEHSGARAAKDFLEEDATLSLSKFYPLLLLSEAEIWQEINQKTIPFNRLYKQGYRSIGCAPCSRAVRSEEDVRAGRWWWENNQKKECGLHVS